MTNLPQRQRGAHLSLVEKDNVAQISNRFPICCIAGLPACGTSRLAPRSGHFQARRLEIGDTAPRGTAGTQLREAFGECVQLAGAFVGGWRLESGSKLHAL